MNVGVVGNPSYHDLRSLLERLAAAAPRLGFTLFIEERLLEYWPAPPPRPPVLSTPPQTPLDCLLTFGGDGTLLRGARLLDGAPTPILGINVGRVGFLATAQAQNLDWALDATARRAFTIEPRLALTTVVREPQGTERPHPTALNDVVVHKGGVARVLRFRVSVDGEEVGTYSADGIIVASPTGSTAYSLSAGGPIVVHGVDAIVVTAICPHTLAVRPLVLPSQAAVKIEPTQPWTDSETIVLSVDGQVASPLRRGEQVLVRRAERPVLLGRLGPEGTFARLRRKLNWGDLSDRERK